MIGFTGFASGAWSRQRPKAASPVAAAMHGANMCGTCQLTTPGHPRLPHGITIHVMTHSAPVGDMVMTHHYRDQRRKLVQPPARGVRPEEAHEIEPVGEYATSCQYLFAGAETIVLSKLRVVMRVGSSELPRHPEDRIGNEEDAWRERHDWDRHVHNAGSLTPPPSRSAAGPVEEPGRTWTHRQPGK